jgi:hypothetical protein
MLVGRMRIARSDVRGLPHAGRASPTRTAGWLALPYAQQGNRLIDGPSPRSGATFCHPLYGDLGVRQLNRAGQRLARPASDIPRLALNRMRICYHNDFPEHTCEVVITETAV